MSYAGSVGGTDKRPPAAARFIVHSLVLFFSIVPALSFVPVYPLFAPVLLPGHWLAAAIGGWSLRLIYGLFNAFVAWQTLVIAVWGFTRCGGHPAVWYAALPGAVLVGVAMVMSSAQGLQRRTFGRYSMFFVPVLLITALSLFFFNPGSNSFVSPGC